MMKSKANQANNYEITKTAKNLILLLVVGIIEIFFMLILLENLLIPASLQLLSFQKAYYLFFALKSLHSNVLTCTFLHKNFFLTHPQSI